MNENITLNVDFLRSAGMTDEAIAQLLAVQAAQAAQVDAKTELRSFVDNAANADYLSAAQAVNSVKAELDGALERVKTLRAQFTEAQDKVQSVYPEQDKTYRHLVATSTGTANIKIKVSAGRRSSGGSGRRGASAWKLSFDGADGATWRTVHDSLGLNVPDGNFNARKRILSAYNAAVKDANSAAMTYGVALTKSDMARVVISASDKANAEDLSEMLAIGCQSAS